MNERIRELAEQAAKQVSDDLRKEDEAKWYSDLPMDQSKFQEKFAELIVRECGVVAYKTYCQSPGALGIQYKQAIETHFGVKE